MIKLKSLLKETNDIVSTIENYFVKYNNNSIIKDYVEHLEHDLLELPPPITKDEGFIVFAYTADNTMFTKEPFNTALLDVLKKLPKYHGEVYGYHNLKFKNKKLTLDYILSTTTDESLLQGDGFHYNSGNRTLYRIQVKSGVSIEGISLYGDQESEVLLLPGTTLQVVDVNDEYTNLKQI